MSTSCISMGNTKKKKDKKISYKISKKCNVVIDCAIFRPTTTKQMEYNSGMHHHPRGRGGRGGGRGRGGGGGGGGKCFHCNQAGHLARDCPASSSSSSSSASASSSSPSSSLPDLTNMPKYIDSHVHIDYILQKARSRSYQDFQRANRFPPNYEGCIGKFILQYFLFIYL